MARKLYVIELLDGKQWVMSSFGKDWRNNRERMRIELKKAEQQYPDEKYKLTTYVPISRVTKARVEGATLAKRRKR